MWSDCLIRGNFATVTALLISVYPPCFTRKWGQLFLFQAVPTNMLLGLGRPFGMLSGWSFIISMVSVASGESLAFSFYIRTLLEALGISLPIDDRWIACLAVAGLLILAIRG